MLQVIVAAAAALELPALPANVALVGEAVEVTFCVSNAGDVTLTFDSGGRALEDLLVVRIGEGGNLMPLPVTVDGDSLTVGVSASGFYAAIELTPPDNCDPRTHTGSITVNNNAELAPLGGITRLDGDLTLGGAVSNLDVLACLTWISGDLVVSGTTALTDLRLGALASVGGVISVTLSSISRVSLPSLLFAGRDDAGRSIYFEDLGYLSAVDMPNLMETEGTVYLDDMAPQGVALWLDLTRLETIGGNLHLHSLQNLVDLDGFARLRVVQGLLLVGNNVGLVQAEGLRRLERVGAVHMHDNPNLERVHLGSLRSVDDLNGYLSFITLPRLSELDVHSLFDVPTLQLFDLSNRGGGGLALDFGSLYSVGDYLQLGYSPGLQNFSGFFALETIGGDLTIQSNVGLTSLRGLGALSTIGGDLDITNNTLLPTCEAHWLRDNVVRFLGDVVISGNLADTCQ